MHPWVKRGCSSYRYSNVQGSASPAMWGLPTAWRRELTGDFNPCRQLAFERPESGRQTTGKQSRQILGLRGLHRAFSRPHPLR